MKRSTLLSFAALGATVLLVGPAVAGGGLQTAIFSGGCFWTMEHGLEGIPGVVKAVSGFTGGHVVRPSYAQVTTETTGHLESVQVTYDPSKISYATLVDRYWHLIDPTDGGGQACDRGESYHPAIWVSTPEQKRVAEASKAALQVPFKGRIVVPVRQAQAFYPAGPEHQHYANRHPVDYGAYRIGCGRDAVLRSLWGAKANH